jgi:hypothetical protein
VLLFSRHPSRHQSVFELGADRDQAGLEAPPEHMRLLDPSDARRGAPVHTAYPKRISAFATRCFTAMKLSGVTEIESMPHLTRKSANSG